jgi:hypothetical protein
VQVGGLLAALAHFAFDGSIRTVGEDAVQHGGED